MKLNKERILIVSPERWHGLQLSKHHVAQALAARGCQVIWLDPPEKGIRGVRIEPAGDVQIVRYRHWLRGLKRLPSGIGRKYYEDLVASIERLVGGPIEVVWSFDVSRFGDFPAPHAFHLLHLVDLDILHEGDRTIRDADLVLTTTHAIEDHVLRVAPEQRVVRIGHALDKRWLGSPPGAWSPNAPLEIAYAGQLRTDYIDWETLLRIVRAGSDLRFSFYGPFDPSYEQASFQEILMAPNTEFHGLVDKSRLIPALRRADVLLLCYRAARLPDQLANPHKMLEYLSTGVPIVASHTKDYVSHQHLLHMAGPEEDLATVFAHAVGTLDSSQRFERRHERFAFAQEHAIDRVLDRVRDLLNEPVTVTRNK